MNIVKIVKPFFFSDISHIGLANIINKEYPVDISTNERLISRIHARYPVIPKSDVSLVVKMIFESMRELIITRHSVNLHKLFFNFNLLFDKSESGVTLKTQLDTPPPVVKKEINL